MRLGSSHRSLQILLVCSGLLYAQGIENHITYEKGPTGKQTHWRCIRDSCAISRLRQDYRKTTERLGRETA